MTAQERILEISGTDVDEAIAKGLDKLGLERSDVEVEIVDSGSSGFLGIGGREAVVKLTIIGEWSETQGAAGGQADERPTVDPGADIVGAAIDEVEGISGAGVSEDGVSEDGVSEDGISEDGRREEEVAMEIVENLLDKLKFEATTSLDQTEPDDLTGERRWIIDISGEDLGMLIGTRGETLNALQHVARLMTGHAIRQRPKFIIDVQGYRSRREQALSRLAERMAI